MSECEHRFVDRGSDGARCMRCGVYGGVEDLKALHVKQMHRETEDAPRVVIAGNCMSCKKPFTDDRLFFCNECAARATGRELWIATLERSLTYARDRNAEAHNLIQVLQQFVSDDHLRERMRDWLAGKPAPAEHTSEARH